MHEVRVLSVSASPARRGARVALPLFAALCLGLSGCGQKGPLRLPPAASAHGQTPPVQPVSQAASSATR
jgi:predicted small lipoprotein YifL